MAVFTTMQLCTMIIACLSVPASDAAKNLDNLFCMARPAVVSTDHLFFPYFVSLHRCSGSWGTQSPARAKCFPSKTKPVFVTVERGNEKKIITLTNHTSCHKQCTIKKEDCKSPNTYDETACTCTCNYIKPPTKNHCGPLKSWSSRLCGCVCTQAIRSCSQDKYQFDSKTCSCQCRPKRKINCKISGGVFIESKCKCKMAQRQTSEDNPATGKFVGSTAFWIYVLIGEFVVLLICFDSMLYCKRLGVIYRVASKYRKEQIAEDDNDIFQETVPKKINDQLNEGCNSFSSQDSISAFYQISKDSFSATSVVKEIQQ